MDGSRLTRGEKWELALALLAAAALLAAPWVLSPGMPDLAEGAQGVFNRNTNVLTLSAQRDAHGLTNGLGSREFHAVGGQPYEIRQSIPESHGTESSSGRIRRQGYPGPIPGPMYYVMPDGRWSRMERWPLRQAPPEPKEVLDARLEWLRKQQRKEEARRDGDIYEWPSLP